MQHVLAIYAGRAFLGGRGTAFTVRTRASDLLTSSPDAVVVLDFAGVKGVSHSFADELLSPLADLLSSDVPKRVKIANCTQTVEGGLRSVADMHELRMPQVLGQVDQERLPA
jgi:hypothetical protein